MNFTPFNITRIKHVTNKILGKAYFDVDKQNDFILHFPNNRVYEANVGEIIVLYQHINNQKVATHLVTPVDDVVINIENDSHEFGRKVKILAFTNDIKKIKFSVLKIDKLNFHNRGWGSAEKLVDITKYDNIEDFQYDLWNAFKPYFKEDLLLSDIQYSNSIYEIENDVNFVVEEGKRKLANHYIRERNQLIINKKKELASKENKLFCEICKFNFSERYGNIGENFIECHHKIPIASGVVRKTKIEDLALVCSNCHRMLHRKTDEGNYLTIDQLKGIIDSRSQK